MSVNRVIRKLTVDDPQYDSNRVTYEITETTSTDQVMLKTIEECDAQIATLQEAKNSSTARYEAAIAAIQAIKTELLAVE